MSLDSFNWWTLNVDGASRQTRFGIGLQLKSPVGEKIEQAIRLGFNTSNSESEYEAILARIELAATVSTYDECLKHSYYTHVSLAFSCCFDFNYIVLGVRSLI